MRTVDATLLTAVLLNIGIFDVVTVVYTVVADIIGDDDELSRVSTSVLTFSEAAPNDRGS